MVDAAAQQNRLQAAAGFRVAPAVGSVVKGGPPLVVPLRARWDERRQTCRQAWALVGSMINGAVPMWPGARLPAAQANGVWRWHRVRAPG